MANLTHLTTDSPWLINGSDNGMVDSNGNLHFALNTAGKILDRNIEVNIPAGSGITFSGNTVVAAAGYYATSQSVSMTIVSPNFSGGAVTTNASATFTNITATTDTNNGIKIQTKSSASRAAVVYDGDISGWIAKTNGDEGLASEEFVATNGASYYITGVNIPITSGFDITMQKGTSSTGEGNVALNIQTEFYRTTNIAHNGGWININHIYNGAGTTRISAYTVSGDENSLTEQQTVISSGRWVQTTVTPGLSQQGPFYGRVIVDAMSNSANIAAIGSEGSVTTAPSVTISGTTNMATVSGSSKYYFTRSSSSQNGTVQTKYKVTTAGYAPVTAATNDGTINVAPTVTADAQINIPTASGAISLTAGSGNCQYNSNSNITVSDSDTSGCSIAFDGSGSVTAAASVTTNGYISSEDTFAQSQSGVSSTAQAVKYITGAKIVPPTSGTRSFTITVPNGSTTEFIDFVFTVDSSGNVVITEGNL